MIGSAHPVADSIRSTRQGLGQVGQGWLTFLGTLKTTQVMTDDQADQLTEMIHAARGACDVDRGHAARQQRAQTSTPEEDRLVGAEQVWFGEQLGERR